MSKKIDTRREVEITLDFPVQLADRKLEKVTMRRPVMRDLIKNRVDADMSMQASINFLADLCGLVPDELEELDSCDYEKLVEQLLAFRGATLPQGDTLAHPVAPARIWN